jgi:hypothetical protein
MTMRDQMPIMPNYAVIFRTHFWDDFAQRQFDRLLSRGGAGDVYILVDETNGAVGGIKHDRVVRITDQLLTGMGFPRAGTGSLLWFNGDYPLYYFVREHGAYDYYLQLEYDVVLNTDVDSLITRAAADHADFVGLTKGEPVHEWPWRHTCAGAYSLDEVKWQLICLSLFSRRALQSLAARRLEMSRQLQESVITTWPFCEGFIATEMGRSSFKTVELSEYVDTDAYNSWPPFVETDLPAMADNPVIHPLLDQARYINSLFKFKVGLMGYLNVQSLFHRKLRRLPPSAYVSTLLKSFGQKAARTLARPGARRRPFGHVS